MLKLFEKRSQHEEELMDLPDTSAEDFARALTDLRWSNRKLGGIDGLQQELAAMLKRHGKTSASILDLATGCADIPMALVEWGHAHDIDLHITGIDMHEVSVTEARRLIKNTPAISVEQGDALHLPYPDASFDIVISTQFMHHLDDAQAIQMLREKTRLCRLGWIVNDLHRHPMAWLGIKSVGLFTRKGRVFRNDGPLSVLRGFKPAEMTALAKQAGVNNTEVIPHKPYRLVMRWEKTQP